MNDRVVLNVSGLRFETFLRTLNRFPKTLLGNATKRAKFFNPVSNEYYFERHRQSFEAILYYYQSNGKFLIRPASVSSEVFFDEIVFFQLGEQIISKYKQDEGYIFDTVVKSPENRVQNSIWLLFEQPHSSIYARCIAIISVFMVSLSITLFCVETLMPKTTSNSPSSSLSSLVIDDNMGGFDRRDEFLIMETICIIWFSIELLIRFSVAPDKIEFSKQIGNIVDLFSIMPYFMQITETSNKFSVLRTIRLIRVFRIFKLVRHFKGLQILFFTLRASANELALLVFFILIGVILFSSTVYFVELDHPKTDFNSIFDGCWYSIITMTTVGYGEIVPKTNLGKLIGAFCAIAGVLTIALPVPIIVSHFQFYYQSNLTIKKIDKETLKKSSQPDEDNC